MASTHSLTRLRRHLLSVLLLLGGLAAPCTLAADLPARNGEGERRLGERRQAPRAKPRKEEEEETPPASAPKRKPPRVEEEEENQPRPQHRIVRPEDRGKEKPKTAPGKVVAEGGDLKTASRKTRNRVLKEFYKRLAVPSDLVRVKGYNTRVGGEEQREHNETIAPIPPYIGDSPDNLEEALMVTLIDSAGQPNPKKHKLAPRDIVYVKHYEELAVQEVNNFLEVCGILKPDDADYLTPEESLQAAEFALASVVRWHESAVQTHVRKEEGWEKVEQALRKKLLDVLVKQMEVHTKQKDWDAAYALARRLADAFHGASEQAALAKPLTVLLKNTMKDDPVGGSRRLPIVQKRLRDLMELFPNCREFNTVTDDLRDQAQHFLDAARGEKDPGQAMQLLKQAEETWPDLPGLRAFRMALNRSHPVLRVGVRSLPVYMAPGWAGTDAERRTVEMLFEGLVRFSVDSQGMSRYEPALAVGRPRVIPLGRRLRLPANAYWSDNERLNATDVRGTVALYQQRRTGALPGQAYLSPAWAELLEGAEVRGDPFHVNLTLRQGYLEPLSLMTFKVLPGHVLRRLNNLRAWENFAKKPVGSGPFRFVDRLSEPGSGREYAGFLANPNYGSRPDKLGLPLIREIRMYTSQKPIQDLKNGHLDLALDLSAEQAAQARGTAGVSLLLPEPTTPNRRICFLAVNHQKDLLKRPEVRRALALALNRKKLLDDHLRGIFGDRIHKVLNGPYPAGSWACSPDVKPDLYDLDGAQAAMAEVKKPPVGVTRFQLKYPNNDAALARAMQALCQQVKDAKLGIELEPVAEDPLDLRQDVEENQNYELAYYQFDFNDETLWLWPLLGPGNYLHYESGEVEAWLRKIMGHRNFAQVRQDTQLLHKSFLNLDMPLIPLWQLDPLAAVAKKRLHTGPFDPLLVFTNVETWKLLNAE